MLFSYNWLKELVQKLPKPDKLAELLTMHSFEVESVKKVGTDYALDIDVLPNRGPDCLAHMGIARECAALTVSSSKYKVSSIKEDKKTKAKDVVQVEVKDKKQCPRYIARVVTGVKVGKSPEWLKKRLELCGLQSINNVVDVTNYVMLEIGNPLHAFDLEKIESVKSPPSGDHPQGGKTSQKKIIVREAKSGEKITTLDNQKCTLTKDILVIADEKDVLAVAGVKGGKKAEVTTKTHDIVLEAANFDAAMVRKTSQTLGIKTDSSWRFEHGIDPNLAEVAIDRAASLLQELAKSTVAAGRVDVYAKKVVPRTIKLASAQVNSLLGVTISTKDIQKILERLSCSVVKKTAQELTVKVPTFRLDLTAPEDLIEEIGRLYGYEHIPSTFPVGVLVPPKRNVPLFWENRIKNSLKELGYTELYNYSFIGEKEKTLFGYTTKDLVALENPVSEEYSALRPSLLPNLLKNVRDNLRYHDELRLFELGAMMRPHGKQIAEKKILTMVAVQTAGKDTFFQLKGTLETLLHQLRISNVWYDSYEATPEESMRTLWHPERTAELKVGNEEIGFIGEIAPAILKALKIKGTVVAADIDFAKLQQESSEEHEYRPVSPYPAVLRDISVLVPPETKVVDVLNVIHAAAGKLLDDIDLFDMYEGEALPDGKKNFSFHLKFQVDNRTLTAKEVDKIQQKVIGEIEKNPSWEVRK